MQVGNRLNQPAFSGVKCTGAAKEFLKNKGIPKTLHNEINEIAGNHKLVVNLSSSFLAGSFFIPSFLVVREGRKWYNPKTWIAVERRSIHPNTKNIGDVLKTKTREVVKAISKT